MSKTSSFFGPRVLPLHNTATSNNELSTPFSRAFAAWQAILDAYLKAWNALNDVDDHHTAFLAMHVVRHTIGAYKDHLNTRPPKEGDLANLTNLKIRLDEVQALHDTFLDEGHIDYPSFRTATLAELQNLREDTARRCAQYTMNLVCEFLPPLTYSSTMDDLHAIDNAVRLIEAYHALSPLFTHDFDVSPLARLIQTIAAQEAQGFPDYKDEKFASMFEDLTVRIGMIHVARTRNKKRA